MILLPFHQFTIGTELSVEQAMKNLISEVDTADSIPKRDGEKRSFRGKLNQYKFKIFRSVNYINSFQPVISGSMEQFDEETKIDILIRPTYYGLSIMLFWLVITIRWFFLTNYIIVPIIMLCVFFAHLIFGFGFEAREAEKELMRIFDESNISNPTSL